MTTLHPMKSHSNADPEKAHRLRSSLEVLAENESTFLDAVYDVFFQRRPDTHKLFGRFSQAAKRQMVRETLMYAIDQAEGENWVGLNVTALGYKHHEYGVTSDMYVDFLESVVETLVKFSGSAWDPDIEALWREAIDVLNEIMKTAKTR